LQEFKKSLDVFLEVYQQKDIEIGRQFSGELNLPIPLELHGKLAMSAQAQGKSLNSLAEEALGQSVIA
jgi:predicted HicB family RNase H-like nuclease